SRVIMLASSIKKPMTPWSEVEEQLGGVDAAATVLVGDRVFTDVVFGNLHGLLTVLVDPLDPSSLSSPPLVNSISRFERSCSAYLSRSLSPLPHPLSSSLLQPIS
ncbi:MAG: HAD hydrolase-like protein, partial [Legionella sp.]|nr:HAD hydrolase-like protein [Legionella sp.]